MNPGIRLGPYEITASIGAGGMGEVWRARDERLGRDVAVKILPAELTKDPERLRRFEQEARAAGSLNHPNLVTIFDSGTHEGQPYIVMELLEGDTLRDKMPDGARVAVRKAIDYAVQIATGLAAAHEKGIVHRDLKPENLFVCRDGRLKILDFGLAKLTSSQSNPDAPTQRMATTPGAVLGTVAYMSPEQVRGQEVDHRTDIFSFGVILFEMLTGARPFQGPTAADLMSAILHHDMPEAELPPALNGIVRHCLEKSPDERFQSVRDLAFHLQTITGSSPTTKVEPIQTHRLPSRALIIAASAVVLLLAGATAVTHRAGYRWMKPRPMITYAKQLTFGTGEEGDPSISPDGKTFVYASVISGNIDIYLQRIDGRNAINLTKDSNDDGQPAFSPDGTQIAFRSDRNGGGIFVMGATGEAVRRISDFGYNPAWSPDGAKIVCSTESVNSNPRSRGTASELWIIDVRSGGKKLLTGEDRPVQPNWSPHGNRIVYWTARTGSDQRDLMTIDPSRPNAKPVALTNDPAIDWNPIWSPDGRYVYFGSDRGGALGLWRIAVDEASGKALGEPAMITVPAGFAGSFTIDHSGKQLLFASLERFDSVRRGSVDGREVTTVVGGSLPISKYDLSYDGQSIAYTTQGEHDDIFVARSDGTETRQITDSPERKRGVSWTPDGKLLFYSDRTGKLQVWRMNADGSGLEQMTDLANQYWLPRVSPDGRTVHVHNEQGAFVFPVSSIPARAAETLPDPGPGIHFFPSAWSPDSRRILGVYAYAQDVNKTATVVYDTVTKRYDVVAPFGWSATWFPDGKSILVADRQRLKVVEAGTRAVRELPLTADFNSDVIVAVSPDAKYVYWSEEHFEGDVWRVTLDE